MLQDFRKFALRGNLIDMAIGFTVGAAFATVAKSIVTDVIMPPIGLMLGRSDFSDMFWLLRAGTETPAPYTTLADAQAAGAVTVNYGVFVNNVLAFLLVALAMFVVVRMVTKTKDALEGGEADQPGEPTDKKCPHCLSVIPYKASRCAFCTSQLEGGAAAPPAAAG
jgi:large conductance mechanosensitive channel